MIYFLSDVHLGLYSRRQNLTRENKLLNFLSVIKDDCETLFIVGDLFDYWFEYNYVIPKYYYRILATLKDMRLAGINIEYLMGNHDFGHKNFFEQELDIAIFGDDIQREFGGKKFLISHGDGKNNKDTGYKILKKILRNPLALWFYGWLHPDLAIWLARSSSKKSRTYTGHKKWGENDGMEDFALEKIRQGFDYVITGHRHKATYKKLDSGIFIDLGDWLVENPTFARFDGNKTELLHVNEFLSSKK
ncbi:UDP-2,3-diacylglucosamine diphosphatase [Bacteroidota bacterium]